MVPDLDPDKPDPDPVWPDLDPAISGSGSGLPGSRSGNIRIWIRLLPDLDPVAAGSKVPHGLSGPVQALISSGTSFPPSFLAGCECIENYLICICLEDKALSLTNPGI